MDSEGTSPTLPHLKAGAEPRTLVAALSFFELAESTNPDRAQLERWYQQHVIAAGIAPSLPASLGEGTDADIAARLGTARTEVIQALHGLSAAPLDDRFLRAAMAAGHVRREEGRWVVRLEPEEPLSTVVVALFCAAILEDRPLYETNMVVCTRCKCVSFNFRAPGQCRRCRYWVRY